MGADLRRRKKTLGIRSNQHQHRVLCQRPGWDVTVCIKKQISPSLCLCVSLAVISSQLLLLCYHSPTQWTRRPYLISSAGWFTQTQWTHQLLPCWPPGWRLRGGIMTNDVWLLLQWQPSDRCACTCVCMQQSGRKCVYVWRWKLCVIAQCFSYGDMSTHVKGQDDRCVCMRVFGWTGAATPAPHTSCCVTLAMLVPQYHWKQWNSSVLIWCKHMFISIWYSKTLMADMNGFGTNGHLFRWWHKLLKE